MDVSPTIWLALFAGILVMLLVDLFMHRDAHEISVREAAVWSGLWVAIGIAVGAAIWVAYGAEFGMQYFAGYVTEKSLSVDNLFVFVLIMSSFRVPREFQQKVLLVGITVALILRTVFIVAGAALISNFSWVFYLFGLFLVWTAISQLRHASDDEDEEFHEPAVLRLVRRVLPTTDTYAGDRLTTQVAGKRMITPMLVVMIAIGSADLLFAVDSIPAIFGLTEQTFLVFAANAFSLLGLRQLFFLVDGLLDRLVFLGYGLAAILGFIGIKLLVHAMHTNELPFLNGGHHIDVIPEIPTTVSLGFIVVVLAITTAASLYRDRRTRALAATRTADATNTAKPERH